MVFSSCCPTSKADSYRRSEAKAEQRQRRSGQLLGIAQRTSQVVFDHFMERFSPRKLIPVNPKTMGDYLVLKRIEANLSQLEVAKKVGVSKRMVRKWEHGHACPIEDHWQILAGILCLDSAFPKAETQQQSHVLAFTQSATIAGRQ
jgi:DNA-binding transcriptional regulator YiaG